MITINNQKYHAKRTISSDGKVFASKREANRYEELLLLQKAGEISDLKCQVPFEMVINGIKVCKYIADFTYQYKGQYMVEDAKGYRTDVYKLKKKLMWAVHKIKIWEL